MSLRITQGNLFNQALFDIQHSLFHYSQLQQQVSSGRRVNRPSDDPVATLRIIPLDNDLRNLHQYGDNAALARESLDSGAAALQGASDVMQRLRELAVQASNGTISDNDRRSMGDEADQLLGQLLGLANSQQGNHHLFAGTDDTHAPFTRIDGPGGTRVQYNGNHQTMSVRVAPGLDTELNVPGDDVFQSRHRGATLFSGGSTGALPTNAGDTGTGFQTLQVRSDGLGSNAPATVSIGTGTTTALGDLSYTFVAAPPSLSVGGGPAVPLPATNANFATADGRSINLTVTGVPATLTGTFTSRASLSTDGGRSFTSVSDFSSGSVTVQNSDDGTVLNVDVRHLTRTGDESVKFQGTFDSFTALIALRDLLHNKDHLTTDETKSRISGLLGEIDQAHEGVLDGMRELGFRSSSMEAINGRVQSLQQSSTEALSRLQDADLADSILAMQRQDLAYQAALQMSSRIMQTTLASLMR
jgi:flagellar hook-associated protein 3 FlgL